jgi:hypothetical protein
MSYCAFPEHHGITECKPHTQRNLSFQDSELKTAVQWGNYEIYLMMTTEGRNSFNTWHLQKSDKV